MFILPERGVLSKRRVDKLKKDLFYWLTANVEEASEEETEEILKEIERLTDDDLSIVSVIKKTDF